MKDFKVVLGTQVFNSFIIIIIMVNKYIIYPKHLTY